MWRGETRNIVEMLEDMARIAFGGLTRRAHPRRKLNDEVEWRSQMTRLLVGGLTGGLVDNWTNHGGRSGSVLKQRKVIEGRRTMLKNKKHCKGTAHAIRKRECVRQRCLPDEHQQCSA